MRQRGMSVWFRIRFSVCVLCLVVGIVLGLAPLSVFTGGSIHPALHAALFAAPMVFVPLAVLLDLRANHNRFRPGHCRRCGYDLRHAEHEVCPECGGA